MLALLAGHRDRFLAASQLLFEVPCTAGIPDLVLLELDHDAVAARVGTTAITDPVDVRAMLALQGSPQKSFTARDLATTTIVSADHLRRIVLPRLIEGGHIERTSGGWRTNYAFKSLARRIVSIEAKIRNWRGGLGQAIRHTTAADESWLVLDASRSRVASERTEWFAAYGVGLATLSTSGELTTLMAPKINQTRQPHRELLVERAVQLHLGGLVSGPIPRVFGSILTTSIGDDPRLQGASAR